MLVGHYLGHSFDDSMFAWNPWEKSTAHQAVGLDDLNPVAPYDRVDITKSRSLVNAAPVAPRDRSQSVASYMPPDYIAPYSNPRYFPAEHPEEALKVDESNGLPNDMRDRQLLVKADVLRPGGVLRRTLDPKGVYPLAAPGDQLLPGPYAHSTEDRVPQETARFLSQNFERSLKGEEATQLSQAAASTDANGDGAIEFAEWQQEVVGRQGKTDLEATTLWNQFHKGKLTVMTLAEFEAAAASGYDLGQEFVQRDLATVVQLSQSIEQGYWGTGCVCPNGTFVSGAMIKVMPTTLSADNTGINGVKFKCSDGSEVQTAEGPDGAWTQVAECPAGQLAFEVEARYEAFQAGQDNSALNDLRFRCRSTDLSASSELAFGAPLAGEDKYVLVGNSYVLQSQAGPNAGGIIYGAGQVATEGGWSEDLSCGAEDMLCGAQVRIFTAQDAKEDSMGVTDARFFCCKKPLDCAPVCAQNPASPPCKGCQSQVHQSAAAAAAAAPR